MINNNKILAHLLLIMAFMMTNCHTKPNYSQTFIISSDVGQESEEISDELDQSASVINETDILNGTESVDDISDNAIPEFSPLNDINELILTTTHIFQKRRRNRPLLQVNMTKITPIYTIGVRRARNGTLQPTLHVANKLVISPPPQAAPPPILPMMHPNQVEISSKDKLYDEKVSVSKENVVIVTPKPMKVKEFETRSAKTAATRGFSFPSDTDRIIFPSDFETITNSNSFAETPTMGIRFSEGNRFVPRGCANGNSVCTNTEDYPVEHINKVVEQNRARLTDFFGDDIVPQVVQRVDYPDEEPLCHSKEIVLYPTMGQTKDNKWAYIINNGNFSQGVRVEQCIGENRPCAMTDSFPYGYITECKQKYIYRHLLALDENGQTVKNLFRLPACCKCVIRSRYGGNIYSRHGTISTDDTKSEKPDITSTSTSPST
uniref:CSON002625 protein n=1 Tax=Culicoides sonorensis TaxID=179676 RepID=A0A336MQL5_CULSO